MIQVYPKEGDIITGVVELLGVSPGDNSFRVKHKSTFIEIWLPASKTSLAHDSLIPESDTPVNGERVMVTCIQTTPTEEGYSREESYGNLYSVFRLPKNENDSVSSSDSPAPNVLLSSSGFPIGAC